MNRFRFDNTENYTRADLKLLTTAVTVRCVSANIRRKSRCRIASQSAYKLHLILSEHVGEIQRRAGRVFEMGRGIARNPSVPSSD
jgi:hypothetical protein